MDYAAESDRINERFATPVIFSSGVAWAPKLYGPIDQTPYIKYLEENEEKTRVAQQELERS